MNTFPHFPTPGAPNSLRHVAPCFSLGEGVLNLERKVKALGPTYRTVCSLSLRFRIVKRGDRREAFCEPPSPVWLTGGSPLAPQDLPSTPSSLESFLAASPTAHLGHIHQTPPPPTPAPEWVRGPLSGPRRRRP